MKRKFDACVLTTVTFGQKVPKLNNIPVYYSLVSVRLWNSVLKSKVFGLESTYHQGKIFKKILRVMTVCQKLGVILESKVVQKLSLEKKVFSQ